MILKFCDSRSVYKFVVIYVLCAVCIVYTNISLDLCDPNRSRPQAACEVFRVGRYIILHSAARILILAINCVLLSAFVDSCINYKNLNGTGNTKLELLYTFL